MIRCGTVITFREGVTREEAAAALMRLRDVIDLPVGADVWDFPPDHQGGACRFEDGITRRWTIHDAIHEYEDTHGGPVWYIP